MKWLAMRVECAECAFGHESLISEVRIYDSLEAAKAGEEETYNGWADREDGGAYSHSSGGGIEIVPIPN